MKGMIFKKAFLLGGIFLLATFMLVQLSWGCDDDDKWDRDHHDKWDCHRHGKPCQPPKIQRVFLEYQANSIVFEIWGKNFDNGVTPVVTLGGMYKLNVDKDDYSDAHIIATLPPTDKFEYGDYRLVVSTCQDSACNDKYCKDHGPNCKCKYCKDHCSKCKDKYCQDNEHKCRCKDRYSLTITGPSGPSGEQGVIISKISEETVTVQVDQTIYDPKFEIKGTASCNKFGTGWTVTGGGFSNSKYITFRASMPSQNENGWNVVGTLEKNIEVSGEYIEMKIYVVCAQIQ